MGEIRKEQIKQQVFDLYDDYTHNRINRSDLERGLLEYATDAISADDLLHFLLPDYNHKIQIQRDDSRLQTEHIIYSSPNGGGEMKAVLVKPSVSSTERLSGVIVVHENRGLNPHIEDVARRVALSGFIALAPDALSPLGGYPGNDDEGRKLHGQRTTDSMLTDFIAAFHYLRNNPSCNGRIGVVGFCFGGTIANLMAVRLPDLLAAVPFYGGQPPAEYVPEIKAELLLHFAELDTTYNAGWPAYEAALKANHKKYACYFYPNTNHGFHNDTTPRYDETAAKLAWERTIAFLKRILF